MDRSMVRKRMKIRGRGMLCGRARRAVGLLGGKGGRHEAPEGGDEGQDSPAGRAGARSPLAAAAPSGEALRIRHPRLSRGAHVILLLLESRHLSNEAALEFRAGRNPGTVCRVVGSRRPGFALIVP
jgi:hypothetical protein